MASVNNNTAAMERIKLTPQLQSSFIKLIQNGNTYSASCRALGITYQGFRRWMREGEKADDDSNLYRQFYLSLQQAEAMAEITAVCSWQAQIHNDYKSSRDFLAARYPETWGDRKKVTVKVQSDVEHMLKFLSQAMPPNDYALVEAAVDEWMSERGDRWLLPSDDPGSIDTEFSRINSDVG